MSITVPFPGWNEGPGPSPEVPTEQDEELEINRANTRAFIEADPVVLTLTPNALQKTAGGGKRMQPGAPRTPQQFRLIPQSDVQTSVQTPDGIQVTPTFVLMGDWLAVMDRWDTFDLNGHSYQVVSTVRPEHTLNPYFKKADVARN
jgi:hypothetical protein